MTAEQTVTGSAPTAQRVADVLLAAGLAASLYGARVAVDAGRDGSMYYLTPTTQLIGAGEVPAVTAERARKGRRDGAFWGEISEALKRVGIHSWA